MMLGEKLVTAISKKNNDINTFVWKGPKTEKNGSFVQEEKRLVDCTKEELVGFYNHCNSMLYNNNKDYPGRYALLEIIYDQRLRCNAELFLRWMKEEKGIERFILLPTLREFLDKNPSFKASEIYTEQAVGKCPPEFKNIPLDIVIEGCLDKLGKFNKQHITLTFILKQGLWFTAQESKDLTEKDSEGNFRDKLEVAKERLGLTEILTPPFEIDLRLTPKGLTYTQLRAMINLRSKKYSELTTAQLETLRNRVLFSLEDEVRFHIRQWESRKKQIELVCEAKGFTI